MNENNEVKGNGKSVWSKVAIGGAAGIFLGAAPVVLGSFIAPDGDVDEGGAVEPAGASGELDDMSFGDAFTAARAELGPGEVFEWHGNLYSTSTVSEWEEEHPSTEEDLPGYEPGLDEDESSDLDYEEYDDTDDVEVIGLDGVDAIGEDGDVVVGGLSIDGQDVYVMDINNDGEIDVLASDIDGDGIIDESEMTDVSDEHMTFDDLGI